MRTHVCKVNIFSFYSSILVILINSSVASSTERFLTGIFTFFIVVGRARPTTLQFVAPEIFHSATLKLLDRKDELPQAEETELECIFLGLDHLQNLEKLF